MTDDPGAASKASGFASLASLRDAHTQLLLSVRRDRQDAGQRKLISDFIDRAKATGSQLDAPADREAAQNILMYWASQLYSAGDRAALDAGLPLLDPFDPKNAPDLSRVQSPFHGLGAFEESDSRRFLGREQAVEASLERLREQRTVLVIGPPGSGKTSLVLAGVVPALKSRLAAAGQNPVVVTVAPGVHPLASLLKTVHDAAGPQAPPDAAAWLADERQKLQSSPETLAALLEAMLPGRPAILIVDPFSDIFTLCRAQEEREAFAKAIVSAASAAGGSSRLIVIVDDRYRQQTLQLAALKPLEQNNAAVYALLPLASAEVIRVVTSAADTVGLKFDDGILEDLAKDIAGDASGLPALQFALSRLWDERQGNRITWDAYRRVGRPREALERTAESVFASLSEPERTGARQLFLLLIRPTEAGVSAADFSRHRVRRDTLEQSPEAARLMAALEAYEKAGLIRMIPGSRPEDDSFEVAHEALVDAWPSLRKWLQEDREASQKLLQLVAIARRWQESNSDPRSGYLLSGRALEDAEAHVSEAPEIGEFVLASRKEIQRKDRRASWLRNAVIAVLGVLLLIAIWQARRASIEAERARSEAARADREATLARSEAARADGEAASAQRSAENAFKAVNKMLDVVSADRLEGTITVKAAADLLKSAQAIVTAVEDRPELRPTRVDLLLKISDTDILAGDPDAALGNLQSADQILQSFPASEQNDKDWLSRAYQTAYKIGDIKASQNKLDEAIVEYKHAVEIAKQLAERQPDNMERQCNVPFLLNKIGDIYKIRRRWAPALNTYNDSYTVGEHLMKGHPADPKALKTTADAMARIADALSDMTLLADAREEYNLTIGIQEALVQSYPDNNTYLSNLSSSHRGLGNAYLGSGRIGEALNEYRKAQQDEEKLSHNDESNTEWKVALARDHMSIGDACATTDETKKSFDLACAEDNYRQAAGIRDALADKAPARADWQTAAAKSHRALGTVLAQEQKFEAAAAEFKAEADHDGQLAKSQPLNADYQAALADAFDHFGDALAQAGKNGEALDAYQNGLAGVERYLKAKPDDALKGRQDAFAKKIEALGQSR
jgi:tetratricopeptide (TPR) repeat protein